MKSYKSPIATEIALQSEQLIATSTMSVHNTTTTAEQLSQEYSANDWADSDIFE